MILPRLLGLSLAVTLGASPALAQTPSSPTPWGTASASPAAPSSPTPPVRPATESYLRVSLAVFGASAALTATALIPDAAPVTSVTSLLGLTGLFLGGPIVHWAHGRVGHGFAVLGVNLGAMLVGFGLGWGVSCLGGCPRGDFGGLGTLVAGSVGAGIGLVTSNIVNAAVFSERPAARSTPALTLAPTFNVGGGRLSLGVGGSF